jgi:outer membrane protein assembly factor BamB
VTATHRLWQVEKATQRVGSGVIVGDHVYILNENGIMQCIELKTGNTLWAERAGGRTWGSMVHADGKLYVTSQQGETLVLSARPTFEVISRNPLHERTQSSPAFSNGEIFIRTYGHLWCIRNQP